MKFSFIHAADFHIGRQFSVLSKYAYDECSLKLYSDAVEKSLNKIFGIAVSKNVDFILIAGDTFDSGEQDFASQLLLKDFLKKCDEAEIKVFIICGNHDPLTSFNKNTFNYDENSNIKIIGLNTPIAAKLPVYNKEGGQICMLHALSFETEKCSENPIRYFEKPSIDDSKYLNIGLLHCDLNACSTSNYAPCSENELKELGYDYFALGHIHIPSNDCGNIIYSGTIQGRNTKETGAHGIRYIEAESKNIVKNEFIPVDVIRFENLSVDISSCDDLTSAADVISEKINSLISKSFCEKYLIKLNLEGSVKFYSQIDENFYTPLSEKIKSDFGGKVYFSELINSLTPCADPQLLQEDNGITGELYRTAKNDGIASVLFDEIYSNLKSLSDKCCFNEEELKKFKQTVIENAKEDCISICSSLYYDSEENNG